jgi:hypothetical protein
MIAQDTGHDLIMEDEFKGSNLNQLSAFTQANYSPMVIQCPFLSDIIHDLNWLIGQDMDKTLIVFMHRYRKHIIESEERVERVDFNSVARGQKNKYHTDSEQHISDIKYEAWEDQRKVIPHYLDVGYESLSEHPLWIQDRQNLKFQHEIAKPRLPRQFADGIRTLQEI